MTPSPIAQWNWHPVVHQHEFEEQLYFYLIRLDQPLHRPVTEQVRDMLALADIEYACEYSIFGYWDGFIRVWLSATSRNRLERVFRTAEANVSDVRYFLADEIRHFWLDDSDTRKATSDDLLGLGDIEQKRLVDLVGKYDKEIRELAMDPSREVLSDDPLVKHGLIFERVQPREDEVKFYVSLERVGGDTTRALETKEILQALESSGLGTSNASLYSGTGTFADYLVRGSSKTYSGVLTDTCAFDIDLSDTTLRSMTLLIANTDAREYDYVNDIDGLRGQDERTARRLQLPNSEINLLKQLPKKERDALDVLVVDSFRVADENEPLLERLRQMLRASLTNDSDAVRSSVAFLLESEWIAGEYLKRAFGSYESEWVSVLVRQFEDYGSAAGTKEADRTRAAECARMVPTPDEWTLGTILNLSILASELNPVLEGLIAGDLGEDWKTELRNLREVRNFIAHGRTRMMKDSFDKFSGGWGDMLEQLTRAALLHARIESAYEKRNRKA